MYKIVITEIKNEMRSEPGEYCTIDERPYTEKELNDMMSYDRDKHKGTLKNIRGYAPNQDRSIEIQTKVLEQTVEQLDLAAVIKAINDL